MMKVLTYSLLVLLVLPALVHAQDAPLTPDDTTMEARLDQAWAQVREYFQLRREDRASEADDPQPEFAAEFFEYFRRHSDTPTGIDAGNAAFMMWGNVGAADEIEQAVSHVPVESRLWSTILVSIGNAYARSERWDEYVELLIQLEDEITHPESRSELLLHLARHHSEREKPEYARRYYEDVIQLNARPFDVQKAESSLYEMTTLNLGQIAPDFTAETIEGESIALSDLRGKVVILEFWATTCGPCLPDIPHLRSMKERFAETDFQIIGITQDEDLDLLNAFLQERDMTWPQLQQLARFEDAVLEQDEVLARYNVLWIPRSFLIDRDGTIAAKDLRGEDLVEATASLVAGK